VEAIDQCLSRIVDAIEAMRGELLITADHGNVEQMLDADSGQPLTSHTNGPVPLVYVGGSGRQFLAEGCLSDIAPTLLSLLAMPIPTEMNGKVLMRDAAPTTVAAEESGATN
jgi:2,3-bisphosphoglycerate-independent phosphoglycerate mutase